MRRRSASIAISMRRRWLWHTRGYCLERNRVIVYTFRVGSQTQRTGLIGITLVHYVSATGVGPQWMGQVHIRDVSQRHRRHAQFTRVGRALVIPPISFMFCIVYQGLDAVPLVHTNGRKQASMAQTVAYNGSTKTFHGLRRSGVGSTTYA